MNIDVLIVEDGFLTASFIKSVILEQGIIKADIVDNATDAEKLFEQTTYDLIFMDINIKGPIDGIELGIKLHKEFSSKVIFITAYQDSQTINKASFANPIGYLVKPVVQAEIESIIMIAKRSFDIPKDTNTVLLPGYTYNQEKKSFSKADNSIKLSKLESKALYLLIKNKNKIVENEQLKSYLWKEQRSDSTVRELIFRLRKKALDLDIQSYFNTGYILKTNEEVK